MTEIIELGWRRVLGRLLGLIVVELHKIRLRIILMIELALQLLLLMKHPMGLGLL